MGFGDPGSLGPIEEKSEKTIVETPIGNALCGSKRQGAVSGWSNNPTI